MKNLTLSEEAIKVALRKYGRIMMTPSMCSHINLKDGERLVCRKCGRIIIEQPDGFKFFYLANGVHYLTKRPNEEK